MLKRYIPGTADWYIIKKFFSTFFFTLIIFVSVAVVFDYAEKVDDFMQRNAPMNEVLSRYYLNFIPYYSSTLSPLLIFIATIFFTSKMANNTEIVPILSGGVSFYRFLYPYLLASTFLGLMIFVTNGYILPLSNKKRIEFEKEYSLSKNILGYKDQVTNSIWNDLKEVLCNRD
jgi:lipopolysaccharide export system permease protein